MTDHGHAALAAEIASALGETGAPGQAPRARVEAQIAGMVALMGETWSRATLRTAQEATEDRALNELLLKHRDGSERALGGVFFAVARTVAWPRVVSGVMPRRQFYATFCWREPQPKPPKLPQPRKEKKAKSPPAPKPKRTHDRRASNPSAATIVYVRRAK